MTTAKPHRSVTLAAQQWAFLKMEAERLGIAVSELLRRIVDRYREEQFGWHTTMADIENPSRDRSATDVTMEMAAVDVEVYHAMRAAREKR